MRLLSAASVQADWHTLAEAGRAWDREDAGHTYHMVEAGGSSPRADAEVVVE